VDDVKLKTINAYSGNTTCQKTYTSPAFTEAKSHTVVIKNISPAGKYIDIDAMEITLAPSPARPGIYDDVDPLWLYSANWTAATASDAYAGTFHRANTKYSSATFVFQTSGRFVLYYQKGRDLGAFTIYVDGVKLKTINAYNNTAAFQQKYISPIYADYKVHTVVIEKTSPTGTDITIDAIQIE
jgi:lipoprotein-anchoring transpeptidase ErfK/SrfK